MKILLTNDDGYQSPGIQILRDVLTRDHDVTVMAPSGDRSGYSHSISLRVPVKMDEIGDGVWSCSGTPVDCVVYGTRGFFDEKFDMILSGINIGPNLGSDLLYSGTAAAARQGAFYGIPSVALSLSQFKPPYNFTGIAGFVSDHLTELYDLWEDGCFLNLNFPQNMDDSSELEWTWPVRRNYQDEVVRFQPPRDSGTYCFLKGQMISSPEEEGSDLRAVQKGNISISAINLNPVILPHVGRVQEKAGSGC